MTLPREHCPLCLRSVALRVTGQMRKHQGKTSRICPGSGMTVDEATQGAGRAQAYVDEVEKVLAELTDPLASVEAVKDEIREMQGGPIPPEEEVDGVIVDSEEMSPSLALVPWGTGEVLDLSSVDDRKIAETLEAAKQWEADVLKPFKRLLHELVLGRMDADAEWTIHVDGFDLSAPSPNLKEYNVDQVRALLNQLVAEGKITKDAADKGVKSEVKWSVVVGGLNKLVKISDEIKERVEACKVPSTKTRSVTIKPKQVSHA